MPSGLPGVVLLDELLIIAPSDLVMLPVISLDLVFSLDMLLDVVLLLSMLLIIAKLLEARSVVMSDNP